MRPCGRAAALVCLAVFTFGGVGGCWQRPARSVGAAHERFRRAVVAGDAGALFRSLDQQSQWSVITTQKYYREVRAEVATGYPPEARARELERTAGAERGRPADFFAAQAARRGWLKRCAGGDAPAAAIAEQGHEAVVTTTAGRRFAYAYTDRGGWGFAGLQAELEELKRRASHDVEMAKENARVHRQAGGATGGTAP